MPRAEPISTASEVELKILERTVRGDTARRVPFFVPGGDMERSVRCLLAWMNEGEAINALLGRLPGLGEDVQTQRATWEAARDANNARPAFRPPTAVFEELPPELRAAGAAFSQRPDAIAAFQSMEWSVGMADLHEVLSFQRIVAEEQCFGDLPAETTAERNDCRAGSVLAITFSSGVADGEDGYAHIRRASAT